MLQYIPRLILTLPMAAAFFAVIAPAADAPPVLPSGSVRGLALSDNGYAVPSANVVIHSADGATTRFVTTDRAGIFAAGDLKPGTYQVMATKKGLAERASVWVQIVPNQIARPSLVFGMEAPGPAAASNPPSPSPAVEQEITELKNRIAALETLLLAHNAPAATPITSGPIPSAPIASAPVTSAPISSTPTPSAPPEPAQASPGPQALQPAPNAAAAQTAPAPTPVDMVTPFADHDWSWLNGNPRSGPAFDTKFFTPEIRADVTYAYDFNHPHDNSISGSSEIFRHDEIQVEQLGVGGDFHWDNVRARLMTQFGMYSETTPRNDASPAWGQWDLDTAYRYVSEAYGGYHIDVLHGMNVDAGIFMSYVGLFSYYNFDNWAYQPSFVSSNTPWFFNGMRIQIFPTNHLKVEPWIINGWQSYGSVNHRKGIGGQIKYTPFGWLNIISNNYGLGQDDIYTPGRKRIHTDDSFEVKYYDKPTKFLDRMAFSFTGDLGCEYGAGVSCHGDTKNGPKQSFVGFMYYNRWWFDKDHYAFTLGGGMINNPGRYLVLVPPINGATAASAALNAPYFTENPGDPFKAWDVSATYDYMPRPWLTFRWEGDFRHSNVPYWSGPGGITPPPGTNNGFPTQFACNNGAPSLTIAGCAGNGGVWYPDLRRREWILDFDILVKF